MVEFAKALADLVDRINLVVTLYFILLGVTVVLVLIAISKLNSMRDKMDGMMRESSEMRHELSLLKQMRRNEVK